MIAFFPSHFIIILEIEFLKTKTEETNIIAKNINIYSMNINLIKFYF